MNTVKAFLLCLIISLLTSCTGMITPTVLATQTLVPPTPEYTLTPSPTETPESTATPEPTATKVNMFTKENLTRIPKSEAEIATSCVEVASPIDNWDQYSKDMDKVLAVFPEIMKDYNGPYLDTQSKVIGVSSQNLTFYTGANLVPVMCVKFKYKDEWAVQLTMAARDESGPVPFHIIVNPDKTLEGDVKVTSIDKILKMLPGKIDGNMSMAEALFCPWTNDMSLYWNSPFVIDYFANENNAGYAEIFWNSWFSKNKFDLANGGKKAVVLSTWYMPQK